MVDVGDAVDVVGVVVDVRSAVVFVVAVGGGARGIVAVAVWPRLLWSSFCKNIFKIKKML